MGLVEKIEKFIDDDLFGDSNNSIEKDSKAKTTEVKSAGLAAVLSFFIVGLGQIYNGQMEKGFLIIAGEIVIFLLILVSAWFFPLLTVLWIFAIYDAYTEAEKINERS